MMLISVLLLTLHASPGDPAIVLLRSGDVEAFAARHSSVTVLRRLTSLRGAVVAIPPALWTEVQHDADVRSLEADQLGHPQLEEATALIGARAVQVEQGVTGRGVRIAVMDTGVDREHPDLDGGLLREKCFVLGGCQPGNMDTGDEAPEGSGHGTHVTGILTSDGVVAPKGTAPGSQVVAIRVFNSQSVGRVTDWVAALDWVLSTRNETGVRLINMSLGTDHLWAGDCDGDQPALTEVVAQLRDAGVLVFAASGNDGNAQAMSAPACVAGVVSVGAVYDADLDREPDNGTYSSGCFDPNADAGSVVCFSNSSDTLDLLAPGSRIRSSLPGGRAGERRGTSQASPMAVGVAALILEVEPTLTADQLEQLLEASGVPTSDPKRDGGVTPRVDARAALERLQDTQCERRAAGAACDAVRVCDAGTCDVTEGVCVQRACVFSASALTGNYPAACGCGNGEALLVALALLLVRVARRR